jgi:hypothetical protein
MVRRIERLLLQVPVIKWLHKQRASPPRLRMGSLDNLYPPGNTRCGFSRTAGTTSFKSASKERDLSREQSIHQRNGRSPGGAA